MARKSGLILIAALLAGFGATALSAQKSVTPAPKPMLSYADMADLALAAPIVAEVRVRRASPLKGALAPGLQPGQQRYLVEADVMALIRGAGGLPPRISYILDVGLTADGRSQKPGKSGHMIFAHPVAGRPEQLRLVAPDAQQPLSPDLATVVRSILSSAQGGDAPPRLLGVGQAFHVPGVLPGEGETQVFLEAADGRPLSLGIWRQQGRDVRWAVSPGELVDERAAPPARDTLAWYRLACFLPRQLPAASTAALAPAEAEAAARDYRVVIDGLGLCQRTRERRNPARNS
jgi:hypothetical protein